MEYIYTIMGDGMVLVYTSVILYYIYLYKTGIEQKNIIYKTI